MKKYFVNKKILTASFIIIFFFLLPLPVLYKWFSHGTIMYFWDINFPLDPKLGIIHFFSIWKTNIFPGFFDPAWSWLPYMMILDVFYAFFHSISVMQAVLYWSLLVSSLITFYYLIRYLFKLLELQEHISISFAAILGAILYTFNTYIYYYSFRIFNPQEFIIAFLPLHFLALLHLFPLEENKERKKSNWLFLFFFSLLLMTSGFSTIIYYIEYLGIIIFYLLFQIIYRKRWSLPEICSSFLFFVMIFVFNLWWFFPIYLGLHDVYTKAAQIGTLIYFTLASQLSNLLNATRLIGLPPMQTPLFSWENLYVTNRLFTFPLFIFPLFIILLAFQFRKLSAKGIILFLFTVFTILLFIVKEANPPFSFILQFAFAHIPFFGVFRDAYQKAGLFYMFIYFILFSLSFGVVSNNTTWGKKYIGGVAIGFAIIATIIMTAPFFIFQNIPFFKTVSQNTSVTFSAKTKIPDQYVHLKYILEPRCKNTPVLVVPRTSILSSGYWPQTKYSYVGQDILSNLIGCDFISTQLLDNTIDAYYSVPYLDLQQGDITSFKNFLFQTGIQLVVIRHDYVSNGLTDYVNVDAKAVGNALANDNDFVHVYTNNMFDVYRYQRNPVVIDGVTFPQVTAYTNADLTSAHTTQILFGTLPSQHVFINNDPASASSKDQSILFANCIGCEYLPGSGVLDEGKTVQSQINPITQFVKGLLHRKNTQEDTLDARLSAMETAFQTWEQSGSVNDANTYIADVGAVMKLYKRSLTNDFFTNDYITIKVKNYLLNENNSLTQNMNANENFEKQDDINFLEETNIQFVEDKVWETDFTSHIIRYRLDIPQTDTYMCQVKNGNNLLSPGLLTIDKNPVNNTQVILQKGSHTAEIPYTSQSLYEQSPLPMNGSTTIIQKTAIHGFTPGNYYSINMQIATASAKNIIVLISNQNIATNKIVALEKKKDQSFIYQSQRSIQDFGYGFSDYFYSSSNNTDSYYVYIIVNLRLNEHNLVFTHFSITPIPTKDTFVLYCQNTFNTSSPNTIFSVNKKSPTDYVVSVDSKNPVQNRILTFNQSYHPLWIAYSIVNNKKHIFAHMLQAGYANAWYIDTTGNGKIYITFLPQQQSKEIAVVSGIIFILLLCIFIFIKKKRGDA